MRFRMIGNDAAPTKKVVGEQSRARFAAMRASTAANPGNVEKEDLALMIIVEERESGEVRSHLYEGCDKDS